MGKKSRRAEFDKLLKQPCDAGTGDDLKTQMLRVGLMEACRPDSDNFAAMQRLYVTQALGAPAEEVDVNVGAQRGLFLSEAGAAMFGVQRVRARVVNEDGEAEEIEITADEDDGGDD